MGNVLMQDDALGPYVARVLEARYLFADHVAVEDVGTPGLDMSPYLDGARAVLVIDTVHADGPPGSITIYRRDQLLATPIPDRSSPHQPGLREALMAAELSEGMPAEVILIGVVPATTDAGTALSQAVHDAIEAVVAAVVRELERLGAPPDVRQPAAEPDIWWK
jgi:hydrogenase maturation protease